MAPVIKEFQKNRKLFTIIVCVSGQHREMLDHVLSCFAIKPDIDLNIMQENQSLDALTADAIKVITKAIVQVRPQLILVQGDTTTAMAAALAGFYKKIPIGHVEAGLRTNNMYNPFPEEANRQIISVLSTLNFAPTKHAFSTLLKEGVPKKQIFFTGNTVVDALKMLLKQPRRIKPGYKVSSGNRLILVTAHRRENFGRPLENICLALKEISRRNKNVEIIYPVHLNPNVKMPVYRLLSGIERIHLIKPVEYHELACLLKQAYLVLTDSGGIQEEAPTFAKPVLVLRQETERPEGIVAGVAKLVGTNRHKILREVELLLNNRNLYNKMSKAISPYGDGKAAKRIINIIRKKRKELS